MSSSVRSLNRCAEQHFADYTCGRPVGGRPVRAFVAYDEMGDPQRLTPTDCLAPNLLSMRLGYADVVPMFEVPPDEVTDLLPHIALFRAMQAVLDDPRSLDERFVELNLSDSEGLWAKVREAMLSSESVPNMTAVAVSKILHRKRPDLVPIYDSKVFEFYIGRHPSGRSAPGKFWPALQADLRAHEDWLLQTSQGVQTPDGRIVSSLRVADIVIWEHTVTGCQLAPKEG